ncbi:9762_t:CDS:1, partial [Cetraspora pellucida]
QLDNYSMIMTSKKTQSEQERQEFEKVLQELEDPKNIGQGSWALPRNATPLQKAKYKLCRQLLAYQMENKLTDREMRERTNLSQDKLEDILFYRLGKVNSEVLIEAVSRVYAPCEIEVIIKEDKNLHARII